jgi:hypothetical protein
MFRPGLGWRHVQGKRTLNRIGCPGFDQRGRIVISFCVIRQRYRQFPLALVAVNERAMIS